MRFRSLSDEDLMRFLKTAPASDVPEAFQEVVHRYKDRIVNYLYRYCGNRTTSEDLAQEAFLRVFRNRENYDSGAKFTTWLYTIATNLAKDEFKRRARHPARSLDWESGGGADTTRNVPGLTADEELEPDAESERGELRDQIQKALERLKPEDKEVLVLREVQHLSYDEIGRILAVPMGTVKSRIARARMAFVDVWEEMERR